MSNFDEKVIHACRTCLSKNVTNGVKLSEGHGVYSKMYEYCLGVTILLEDEPQTLCSDCFQKLNEFADFKKQARKSDKLWRELITISAKNTNENVNDEIENLHSNTVKEEGVKKEICIKEENIDAEYLDDNVIADIDFDDIRYDNMYVSQDIKTNNNFKHSGLSGKRKQHRVKKSLNSKVTKKRVKSSKCKKINKYDESIKKLDCDYKLNSSKDNNTLKDKGSFYCGLCDTIALDINELRSHLTEHGSLNELNCKSCDFVGRDFADMVSHRYAHLNNTNYKIKFCHLCNNISRMALSLQFHYRSAHLNKIGGFCTVCSKQFKCYRAWRNHERSHKIKKFICDICGLKFLFRNAIEEHIINHMGIKFFICDICGRGFTRHSNLKAHLKTSHTYNPVKCTHCDRTFKHETSLSYHLREVNAEKPYQCEVCSKCYSKPGALKDHMIWHSDDRPFVCSTCGSAYKAKSQLKIHMLVHTGEKPFKCEECYKCFPTQKQLRTHSSVHTGVRKHKCSECPRSFHEKRLLNAHYRKKHELG